MPWVESESQSFQARHEEADAAEVAALLQRLESFRLRVADLLPAAPINIAVVVHPRSSMLGLAHPWLPTARFFAAPAGRRYMAGWFTRSEIHVLAPAALAKRASKVPGSREALDLTPEREYSQLALGASNQLLPPPFTPASFTRYLRWAWLAEGAAAWLSGQTRHLGPAIARRMREGGRPDFPPSTRDSVLLGGTVFDMLQEGAGPGACMDLALKLDAAGARVALERVFARPAAEVERDWRDYLDELSGG